MSASSNTLQTASGARLRVPADDGGVLVVPGLRNCSALIAENARRIDLSSELPIQGRTLGQLCKQARSEMLAAAFRYTSEIRSHVELPMGDGPLIVSGHQPDLFHPGVWVKNFVIDSLARQTGGTALNLVVDNDICQSASIKIPTGTATHPQTQPLQIDHPLPAQPWEERHIVDSEHVEEFAKRAMEAMSTWNSKSVAAELWNHLPSTLAGKRLADVLTRIRSRHEQQQGLSNLELPISHVCSLESFHRFACHLFVNLPRFHKVHNHALAEYRKVNKIRSRTHPVPELVQQGKWWEAPFWVWREGDTQRKQLFARQASAKVVELFDGESVIAELPLGPDMDACCAAEVLAAVNAKGIRIRTRALTTTVFSRLLAADAFVHGIGGAKYDELTDVILGDFYGIEVPGFITASATLRLLKDHAKQLADTNELRAAKRDLKFNPERHLIDGSVEVRELLEEKRQLLNVEQSKGKDRISETPADHQRNKERYRRLRGINTLLAEHTRPAREELQRQIDVVEQQTAANEILNGRDYSFALYPAERLEAMVASVWSGA